MSDLEFVNQIGQSLGMKPEEDDLSFVNQIETELRQLGEEAWQSTQAMEKETSGADIRAAGTGAAIGGSLIPGIGDLVISPAIMAGSEFQASKAEGLSNKDAFLRAAKVGVTDALLGLILPAAASIGKKVVNLPKIARIASKAEKTKGAVSEGIKETLNPLSELVFGRKIDDLAKLAKLQKKTGKTLLTKKQGQEAMDQAFDRYRKFRESDLAKMRKQLYKPPSKYRIKRGKKALEDMQDIGAMRPETLAKNIERETGIVAKKGDIPRSNIIETLRKDYGVEAVDPIKKKDIPILHRLLFANISPASAAVDFLLPLVAANDKVQRIVLSRLSQKVASKGVDITSSAGKRLISRQAAGEYKGDIDDIPQDYLKKIVENLSEEEIQNEIETVLEELGKE